MLPRPFNKWGTYAGHSGIDYPVPVGTPVKASGAGFVAKKTTSARAGNTVWVQYDNGLYVGHSHLRDLSGLAVGTRVDYGVAFCYSGNTGHSTGPHLHHEVYLSGALKAPPAYWDYFSKTNYVGDGSGSGGGSLPFPTPEPVEQEQKDEASMFYVRVDDDGNGRAFFTLHDTQTNVYRPPIYGNAPGWMTKTLGEPVALSRADWLDMGRTIQALTGNVPFQGTMPA